MAKWTADQLDAVDDARELEIASQLRAATDGGAGYTLRVDGGRF